MELFKQNLKNYTFLISTLIHFMMLCKENLKVSSLFKVCFLSFCDLFKKMVENTCKTLTIQVKSFEIQKLLLTSPPLEDIPD